MNLKAVPLFLLITFFLTGCSFAEQKSTCIVFDYPGGFDYNNCPDHSTMGVMRCIGREEKPIQEELDSAYKELEQYATVHEQDNYPPHRDFKAARKAWEEYRNANCQFVSNYAYGGTWQKVYLAQCWNRMTRMQIEDVKAQIEFFKSHP